MSENEKKTTDSNNFNGNFTGFTGGIGNKGQVAGLQSVYNQPSKRTCRGCLQEVGADHQETCRCEQKDGYCEWCEEGLGLRKNCLCQKITSNKELSSSSNKEDIDSLEKSLDKITLNKPIGRGSYGQVYQGTWRGQEVAIKKLFSANIKGINQEINLLKRLKNPNVIGYYHEFQKDNNSYILMEYAEHGSLANFIENNKKQEQNWPFNYNFISQIVKGLSYLHSKQVLHRDVKSHNVLIAKDNTIKLADFGLAKLLDDSYSSNGERIKGTIRWLAPEVIKSGKHSYHSDIYSLGMVIWEISSQSTSPFKDLDNDNTIIFNIANGRKEIIPSDTPAKLKEIIEDCWKENPQERISLDKINSKINELSNIAEEIQSIESEQNNNNDDEIKCEIIELNFLLKN